MNKIKIIILAAIIFYYNCLYSQDLTATQFQYPKQYIRLQGGLTLLEAPIIFYPNIGMSYSKTFWGSGTHQLALNPQFQFIANPTVENKYLLAANAEYKLQTKWRLELNLFAGLNYQLRKLAYDNYEFKDGALENIGKTKHQVGPVLGINLGYKILCRKTFSLSPYLGFSLMKLRKSYTKSLVEGYVPTLFFGIKYNINK